MLYTLVILACLTDAPRTCEVREQVIGDLAMHPAVAFMQAQPLVAQWMDTHPGLTVKRWRLVHGQPVRSAARI